MADRKKQRREREPVQGNLFGTTAEDAYGGHGEVTPEPGPPLPPRWDDGLVPPTPELLDALRAEHPGVMLLFRHRHGCCFHGDDGAVAFSLLGSCGFGHGDFEDAVRKLLRAGKALAVVETGEGLPRPTVPPVVTPVTALPGDVTPRRTGKGTEADA